MLSPFVNADQFPRPTDIGIRLTINERQGRQQPRHAQSDRAADPASPGISRYRLAMVLTGAVRPGLNSGDELLLELPGASGLKTRVLLNRCGRRGTDFLAPAAEATGRLADA